MVASKSQTNSTATANQPAGHIKPSATMPKPALKHHLKNFIRQHRAISILVALLLIFLLISVYPVYRTITVATDLHRSSQQTTLHATAVADNLKNQNLPAAKVELDKTREIVAHMDSQYASLSFWRYSPLSWHYADGQAAFSAVATGLDAADILVQAVEPYMDVLGLSGEAPVITGSGTAEDRITTIIDTLPHIIPQLDQVQANIDSVQTDLDRINPKRYPFSIQGRSVADLITQAKTTIHQLNQGLTDYRPVIQQLPNIAGGNEKKTYIVLFQNDGELRATGGFITAYAQIDIEKGKITPVRSDDIYELDSKFRQKIDPPPPITEYLDGVYTWNLRDMNLSPDFKTSMDTFVYYYTQVPGEPEDIDGIITVDTQVLTNLISVLGPVEVPGYGVFTAEIVPRCNCPQVVYALENMITRPTPYHRSDRKGVLGPLMQAILHKAYDAPSELNPPLFQQVINDIEQKHILFYFSDPAAQQAAEAINVAGRIKDYDADYLHINDSNFSGAKSNMYVTQEVQQTIALDEAGLTKTITVTYKNPQKADNCNLEAGELCLNSVLRNFVRFYVPLGSHLVESIGFVGDSVKVGQDLDKTVIEGFFTLDPLSQAKISLTYTVPYHPQDEYRLLVQKQPGSKQPEYRLELGHHFQEFTLLTDQEIIIPLP